MATRKETPNVAEEKAEAPANREQELQAEVERLKAQLEGTRNGRVSDYDRVKQLEKETAEAGVDPWTVKVDVIVPHKAPTEDPWYWINVNGISAQIPANDTYQTLKLPWASVLMDVLKAEKRAADYQDSLQVYDPIYNPHKD